MNKTIKNQNNLTEFINKVKLALKLFFDKDVPFLTKLIPIVALIYIISPLDFLPDYIPFMGQVDDLAIFYFAIILFIDYAPSAIVKKYRTYK